MSDTRFKDKQLERKEAAALVWNAIGSTLNLAFQHGVDSVRDPTNNGGEFTLVEAVKPNVEKIIDRLGTVRGGYEQGYQDGYDDCQEDYE